MSLSSEFRLSIFSELDIHGDFVVGIIHFTAKRFMFPHQKKMNKLESNNAAQIAFLRDYLLCSLLFVFFPNRL